MASLTPTGPPVQVPQDVLDVLRRVFGGCNDEVSGTLSRVPTTHEEALDQIFISYLDRTAPVSTPHSGWIIDVQTHFLGGGHHLG